MVRTFHVRLNDKRTNLDNRIPYIHQCIYMYCLVTMNHCNRANRACIHQMRYHLQEVSKQKDSLLELWKSHFRDNRTLAVLIVFDYHIDQYKSAMASNHETDSPLSTHNSLIQNSVGREMERKPGNKHNRTY